jgi:multiple sugar transport system substrate-binding protein
MPGTSRRTVLRGLGGAAVLGAGIPLLSACAGSSTSSDTKTVTVGSNASDAVPKKAYGDVYAAFTKQSGIKVAINTKDHNTFQEQINSYLQGTPDDVFQWFAGYRMQFFAAKGLATPIDDVWKAIGDNFPSAMHDLSKGQDGKYYLVPLTTSPWAVFYRKSVFQKYGYEVPTTWDAYIALCKQMKKDGLVPIAYGDKDAWPAMGSFDQINFRLNGYDFHVELMAGKASWTDAKVRKVFDTWAETLPYHQEGAVGRTWQDAAQRQGNATPPLNPTLGAHPGARGVAPAPVGGQRPDLEQLNKLEARLEEERVRLRQLRETLVQDPSGRGDGGEARRRARDVNRRIIEDEGGDNPQSSARPART